MRLILAAIKQTLMVFILSFFFFFFFSVCFVCLGSKGVVVFVVWSRLKGKANGPKNRNGDFISSERQFSPYHQVFSPAALRRRRGAGRRFFGAQNFLADVLGCMIG